MSPCFPAGSSVHGAPCPTDPGADNRPPSGRAGQFAAPRTLCISPWRCLEPGRLWTHAAVRIRSSRPKSRRAHEVQAMPKKTTRAGERRARSDRFNAARSIERAEQTFRRRAADVGETTLARTLTVVGERASSDVEPGERIAGAFDTRGR